MPPPELPGPPDLPAVAELLRDQAEACALHGSPLYATLLHAAAGDVEAGGPAAAVVTAPAADPSASALALRLMAAVHRLVLRGRAPELAAFYPSVGGTGDPQGAWPSLRRTLADRAAELPALVGRGCQTNEVGRCAALLPGVLAVARTTGLPVRLLEVGASAGLNLRLDAYRYTGEHGSWGDPASPVVLDGRWDVPADLLATGLAVVERRGCDPRPIDPTTDAGLLDLTASVWADQTRRLERLRGAIEVAGAVPATVDAAPVADWLPARLAAPVRGAATVVYHSVVLQYLSERDRAVLSGALAEAGGRATAAAPLAWLRMEPGAPLRAMDVSLTTWPGGRGRRLATAGAHGDPVRWAPSGAQDGAQDGGTAPATLDPS